MLNRAKTKLGSAEWGARALMLLGILLVTQSAAAGPTFVVNSEADVPAGPDTADAICETATGNGVCTLRAAIMEANATRDALIRVPAGLYELTLAATPGLHPEDGDLDVLSPMKIEGDGPSVSIVDGNLQTRVFRISLPFAFTPETVELRGLTVRNGRSPFPGELDGGGILATSSALFENLHITQNEKKFGGGISLLGDGSQQWTLRHCVIDENRSTQGAGMDIFNGTVVIEDSLVEGNVAEVSGGGINLLIDAKVLLLRTAILGNSATDDGNPGVQAFGGGGILVGPSSRLSAASSLVHGNDSDEGGAGILLDAGATANLSHVTVTGNTGYADNFTLAAPPGGGIFNNGAQELTLFSSIVTSNFSQRRSNMPPFVTTVYPSDCNAGALSLDYNLVASTTSCPLLGAVGHDVFATGFLVPGFHGGFTRDVTSDFTTARRAGVCFDPILATDFRGHHRPANVACDIGAHDASGIYRPDAVLGVNLLRNGGASGEELGLASSTQSPAHPERHQAPYWAQQGRVLQLLYGDGAPGGLPARSDAPVGSGHKFLSGGEEASSRGEQLLDVSAFAAQIDTGTLTYTAAGAFGGRLAEDDLARMDVAFYAAGFGLLDEISLGGFTAADRGDQTKLLPAQQVGTVPIGTRMISATVVFERSAGATNDGYADQISLTLPEPGAAASLGAALIGMTGFARRRRALGV